MFGGGEVGRGVGDWGGRGGCERRIKVFVKIQKKIGRGSGGWVGGRGGSGWGGVRVKENEELKILGKFTKKNREGGGREGRGSGGGGSGWWGSGWM